MRRNPERLAWIVLLISFFTCVSLVILVPLGIRWYVLNASVRQKVALEIETGPLSVVWAGRGQPVSVAEDPDDEIPEGTIVTTYSTPGRLVVRTPQIDGPVIATAQLYNNTEVTLSSARSPRFPASRLPHKIALKVRAGRVRINVSSDDDRSTTVEVHTSHGAVTLTEGSYEVKVNGTTTEVIVRDGQADVVKNELFTHLGPDERAIVDSERIAGPLLAARNLIVNGDFQSPLEDGWTSYHEQKEEPPPTVSIIANEGREVANFYRDGSNWAEVGIQQEIDYDVRDFASLELHLAVRIVYENIAGYGGCGTLSSECPIIVRIDYKDIYDSDRYWLHGFYIDEPASDWMLDPWTEQMPPGSWQTYDSGNLMKELSDTPPAIIKQLTIYASGHSFDAMVTEVELLAQE